MRQISYSNQTNAAPKVYLAVSPQSPHIKGNTAFYTIICAYRILSHLALVRSMIQVLCKLVMLAKDSWKRDPLLDVRSNVLFWKGNRGPSIQRAKAGTWLSFRHVMEQFLSFNPKREKSFDDFLFWKRINEKGISTKRNTISSRTIAYRILLAGVWFEHVR